MSTSHAWTGQSARSRLLLALAVLSFTSALYAQPQRVRDGLRDQAAQQRQEQQKQNPAPSAPPPPAHTPSPAPTPTQTSTTSSDTAKPAPVPKTVVKTPAPEKSPTSAPFNYVWGTAYHVDPSTTSDEEGYFSLSEGLDGTIYVGTCFYGKDAYLVAFDPKNDYKQSIVVDAHKVLGLPMTPTGYAAQAKFHTRNFVGPSGKIYLGTKQGYPSEEDKKNDVKYPGGYAMVYDPKSHSTHSLGMPFPTQGVIDTVADEDRGLVYAITCEDQHWMLYENKTRKFKEIDPDLGLIYYGTTLIDKRGYANVINADSTLITYNPDSKKFDSNVLVINTKVNAGVPDPRLYPAGSTQKLGPPTWQIMPDGKTAYLLLMSRPNLYKIDLSKTNPSADQAAPGDGRLVIQDMGPMIKGMGFDSRSSMAVGPDGNLYILAKIDNDTGFGAGAYLHHLIRFNVKEQTFDDLGVLAVKNPDFYGLPLPSPIDPATGKVRPFTHGFHVLPDNTLTPLHAHMGLIAAHDGTLYATILCPYTLLKIETVKAK